MIAAPRHANKGPILEVQDLKTYFRTSEGIATRELSSLLRRASMFSSLRD